MASSLKRRQAVATGSGSGFDIGDFVMNLVGAVAYRNLVQKLVRCFGMQSRAQQDNLPKLGEPKLPYFKPFQKT